MSSSLNVSLTDELRSYVNTRASDAEVYATPHVAMAGLDSRIFREVSPMMSETTALCSMELIYEYHSKTNH